MKKILYIILLSCLVACEDQHQISHRYARQYYLHKVYPIWLDASDIFADIQVLPSIPHDEIFKMTSNGKYFFIGEKMKGIHVYEKTNEYSASPICFIECKHIKAFEVVDNILYCNNFVDLLVVDVEKPLQANIMHREKNFFNNYANNNQNIDYYGDNIYLIGHKQVVLSGIETDALPAPDFSDYDLLYGNMIVKEIPDDLQVDKPYAGFAKHEGTVFTFGSNSIAVCSYASGALNISQPESTYWYYEYYPLLDLLCKDGIIFTITNQGFMYEEHYSINWQNVNYQYWNNPKDVVALRGATYRFVVLDEYSITGTGTNAFSSLGARSLINVNNIILALGAQLTLYRLNLQNISLVLEQIMQYPAISGLLMLRDGNTLVIANNQTLSFYDITNLGNIKLMP